MASWFIIYAFSEEFEILYWAFWFSSKYTVTPYCFGNWLNILAPKSREPPVLPHIRKRGLPLRYFHIALMSWLMITIFRWARGPGDVSGCWLLHEITRWIPGLEHWASTQWKVLPQEYIMPPGSRAYVWNWPRAYRLMFIFRSTTSLLYMRYQCLKLRSSHAEFGQCYAFNLDIDIWWYISISLLQICHRRYSCHHYINYYFLLII